MRVLTGLLVVAALVSPAIGQSAYEELQRELNATRAERDALRMELGLLKLKLAETQKSSAASTTAPPAAAPPATPPPAASAPSSPVATPTVDATAPGGPIVSWTVTVTRNDVPDTRQLERQLWDAKTVLSRAQFEERATKSHASFERTTPKVFINDADNAGASAVRASGQATAARVQVTQLEKQIAEAKRSRTVLATLVDDGSVVQIVLPNTLAETMQVGQTYIIDGSKRVQAGVERIYGVKVRLAGAAAAAASTAPPPTLATAPPAAATAAAADAAPQPAPVAEASDAPAGPVRNWTVNITRNEPIDTKTLEKELADLKSQISTLEFRDRVAKNKANFERKTNTKYFMSDADRAGAESVKAQGQLAAARTRAAQIERQIAEAKRSRVVIGTVIGDGSVLEIVLSNVLADSVKVGQSYVIEGAKRKINGVERLYGSKARLADAAP